MLLKKLTFGSYKALLLSKFIGVLSYKLGYKFLSSCCIFKLRFVKTVCVKNILTWRCKIYRIKLMVKLTKYCTFFYDQFIFHALAIAMFTDEKFKKENMLLCKNLDRPKKVSEFFRPNTMAFSIAKIQVIL